MADLPDAAVQLTDDEYMLDFGDGAEGLLQTAAQGRTSPDENMVSNFRFLILVLFQGMWVLSGSFFMFSNFLPIGFTQRNLLCSINKSTMKHNRIFFLVVMIIGSACLLILDLNYIGPSGCVH